LDQRLPDIVFHGVRIPTELMRDGLFIPTRCLKTETSKNSKGMGSDAREMLTENMPRGGIDPADCIAKRRCDLRIEQEHGLTLGGRRQVA